MPAYTIPIAAVLERDPPDYLPVRNAIIHAGDAVRLLFTVYPRDGEDAPLDLFGTNARFWLRMDGKSCPELMRPTFAVDFAGGRIAVDLALTETANLRGRAEWGLSLGLDGGQATIARGVLNIAESHYLASDLAGGMLAGALVTDLGEPFQADADGTFIAYTE